MSAGIGVGPTATILPFGTLENFKGGSAGLNGGGSFAIFGPSGGLMFPASARGLDLRNPEINISVTGGVGAGGYGDVVGGKIYVWEFDWSHGCVRPLRKRDDKTPATVDHRPQQEQLDPIFGKK